MPRADQNWFSKVRKCENGLGKERKKATSVQRLENLSADENF